MASCVIWNLFIMRYILSAKEEKCRLFINPALALLLLQIVSERMYWLIILDSENACT